MAYSKSVLFLGLLPFVGTVFGAYVEEVKQEQPSENSALEQSNELTGHQSNGALQKAGVQPQNQPTTQQPNGARDDKGEQGASSSNGTVVPANFFEQKNQGQALQNPQGPSERRGGDKNLNLLQIENHVREIKQNPVPNSLDKTIVPANFFNKNHSSTVSQNQVTQQRALPQPNLSQEVSSSHGQNLEANWSVVPANLQQPRERSLPVGPLEEGGTSCDNLVRGKLEEFLNANNVDGRFVNQFISFLKGQGAQKTSDSVAAERSEPHEKIESIEKLKNNDEEIKDFLYRFGNQSNQNTMEIQNLKEKIGSLESLLHMVMIMALCR